MFQKIERGEVAGTMKKAILSELDIDNLVELNFDCPFYSGFIMHESFETMKKTNLRFYCPTCKARFSVPQEQINERLEDWDLK